MSPELPEQKRAERTERETRRNEPGQKANYRGAKALTKCRVKIQGGAGKSGDLDLRHRRNNFRVARQRVRMRVRVLLEPPNRSLSAAVSSTGSLPGEEGGTDLLKLVPEGSSRKLLEQRLHLATSCPAPTVRPSFPSPFDVRVDGRTFSDSKAREEKREMNPQPDVCRSWNETRMAGSSSGPAWCFVSAILLSSLTKILLVARLKRAALERVTLLPAPCFLDWASLLSKLGGQLAHVTTSIRLERVAWWEPRSFDAWCGCPFCKRRSRTRYAEIVFDNGEVTGFLLVQTTKPKLRLKFAVISTRGMLANLTDSLYSQLTWAEYVGAFMVHPYSRGILRVLLPARIASFARKHP